MSHAKVLIFLSLFSFPAFAVQTEGCDAGTTLVAFRSETVPDHDYQARFCDGTWHLNNQAGEDIFFNADGKPCVENETTHQVQCGAQINQDNKVDTKAVLLGRKESRWQYDAKKNELILVPLDESGNVDHKKPFFKVSGETNKKSKDDPDPTGSLNITEEKPDGPTSGDKEGSLSLTHKIGNGTGKCDDGEKLSYEQGKVCRLQNLISHGYNLTDSSSDSKMAFTDDKKPNTPVLSQDGSSVAAGR